MTEPALSEEVTFLRDPQGRLGAHVVSGYDASEELPSGAVDTGWTRDGNELWLDLEGWAAYFASDGGRYETWPRTKGVIACA